MIVDRMIGEGMCEDDRVTSVMEMVMLRPGINIMSEARITTLTLMSGETFANNVASNVATSAMKASYNCDTRPKCFGSDKTPIKAPTSSAARRSPHEPPKRVSMPPDVRLKQRMVTQLGNLSVLLKISSSR